MKKILLILPAILISSSLFSQEAPGPEFGVVGGVNFSSVLDIDCSLKPGFYGGIYGELFDVGTGIVFRSELTYSMQGAEHLKVTDFDRTEKEVIESLNMDYINLAVLLKFYLDRPHTFSLEVGPLVGFNIVHNFKEKNDDNNATNTKVDAESINVCGIIGLSYKLSPKFVVSARYNYGFSSVGRVIYTKDDRSIIKSCHNSVFQAGLSYRIK